MPGRITIKFEPNGLEQKLVDDIIEPMKKALAADARARSHMDDSSEFELLQIGPRYYPSFVIQSIPQNADISAIFATFWNYEKNVGYRVTGKIGQTRDFPVQELRYQPGPVPADFRHAERLLRTLESEYREDIINGVYDLAPTMPHFIDSESPNRAIPVALFSRVPEKPSVVVRVRLNNFTQPNNPRIFFYRNIITRAAPGHPSMSSRNRVVPAPMRLTGGSWITISRDGKEVWKFLAVRPQNTAKLPDIPSDAQGEDMAENGAAIELWAVSFEGTHYIRRANVPIITVKYNELLPNDQFRENGCVESRFNAIGEDKGMGFRECSQLPTTILDSDEDEGGFEGGVAVYALPSDECVTLISELEAGHYRFNCS